MDLDEMGNEGVSYEEEAEDVEEPPEQEDILGECLWLWVSHVLYGFECVGVDVCICIYASVSA